jgi:phosphoserine phosphatase
MTATFRRAPEPQMFVATLVHPDGLRPATLDAARHLLTTAGAEPSAAVWLQPGHAADIRFTGADLHSARRALEQLWDQADVFVQPEAGRAKRLLVADMDSTIITIECIDELADFVGAKAQVSAITEAAMRGELDFVGALDARVALLKGLPASIVDRCYRERVVLTTGARTLVRTMVAHGAHAVLVSGGFTSIAERVGADAGFTRVHANHLELDEQGSSLLGTVRRPVVTAAVKRETLEEEVRRLGLSMSETLAVGDGANDIPMIELAGLGVAYRGKARTEAAADAVMRHSDLTALLHAQGYPRASWAS